MSEEEGRVAKIWTSTDSFSRYYAIFGLTMVTIFFTQVFVDYWALSMMICVSFPLFLHIELTLSTVMNDMATSSSYFGRLPLFLYPWAFILIAASIGGWYMFSLPIMPDTSLPATYLYSLLQSILLFILASGFKCLLLASGLINFKLTRRGFFGVFQRLFILVRNFIVIPVWIGYFCSKPNPEFSDIFTLEKTAWCKVYMVIKSFIQLWLLWDLGSTLKNYGANRTTAFTPAPPEDTTEECIICQDEPYEPVILPCGHVFCYKCLVRWIEENNTCPTCRSVILESKPIEFGDGYMPYTTIFSCF